MTLVTIFEYVFGGDAYAVLDDMTGTATGAVQVTGSGNATLDNMGAAAESHECIGDQGTLPWVTFNW